MRFISGFILGVLVTIAVAYVHDSSVAPAMTGPDASASRMVNWDVVSRSFNRLATSLHDDFDRLLGRQHAPSSSGI